MELFNALSNRSENVPVVLAPVRVPGRQVSAATLGKKETWHAPYKDFAMATGNLGAYIFDIGSDISLAVEFYEEDSMLWALLTLIFALLPPVIMFLVELAGSGRESLDKFCDALKGPIKPVLIWYSSVKVSGKVIVARIKGEIPEQNQWSERRQSVHREEDEDDLRTFKLVECFFETVPDLYLQLYIICAEGKSGSWLQQMNLAKSTVMTAHLAASIPGDVSKTLDTYNEFNETKFYLCLVVSGLIIAPTHALAVVLFMATYKYYILAWVLPQYVLFFLAWMRKTLGVYSDPNECILPSLIQATSMIVALHNFGFHIRRDVKMHDIECAIYFWLFHFSVGFTNAGLITYWYLFSGCLFKYGFYLLIGVVLGTTIGFLLDTLSMWIFSPKYLFGPEEYTSEWFLYGLRNKLHDKMDTRNEMLIASEKKMTGPSGEANDAKTVEQSRL